MIFEEVNISGDLLTSGDIIDPEIEQVLLCTGTINHKASNHCYFNITVSLYSSAPCLFEIGVYNADNSKLKSFICSVLADNSKVIAFEKIPIADGKKFRIVSGSTIQGKVNVALNLTAVGQD